jgi:Family of unknown function (DUF5946)
VDAGQRNLLFSMPENRGASSDQDLYNELSYYTLAHGDRSFIHQHIVDAFAAQHASDASTPIAVVFALVGLYLHIEKGFTGRQVQRVHMQLARSRRQWPKMQPPEERGAITVADVLSAQPGPKRDAMIRRWCASVWEAWTGSRSRIVELLRTELGIDESSIIPARKS